MKFQADEFAKGARSVAPDAHGVGVVTGAEVDTREFGEALVVLDVGTMGGGATLDVKVREAAESGGTFADVPGAAFSQKVAGTDDNRLFVGRINLQNRQRILRVVSTVGVASVDHGASVVLLDPKYAPAEQDRPVEFDVDA
jgi:hypothetical protein